MRALVYGFANSTTATATAASAFQKCGVTISGWMLHENWIKRSGAQVQKLGARLIPEGPPDKSVERIRHAVAFPTLTASEEENLRYLADRERVFDHEWQRTLFIQRRLLHVSQALREAEPEICVFGVLPHSLSSYLLYLYCREQAVPTAILRSGPSPFQFSYVGSIDGVLVDLLNPTRRTGTPTECSERYIASLHGEYKDAMPAYIRTRLGVGSIARRAALQVRPSKVAKSASTARGLARRQVLRRSYERMALESAEISSFGDGVITVFLHTQPERTTTPEGGRFSQQWLIVQLLASRLPHGWTILVREHPMTFHGSPRLVRDSAFYRALQAFDNVHLASTAISPYELIERSDAVATVTGTVGFEAATKGCRVLCFGNAAYLGCEGVTRVPVGGTGQLLDPMGFGQSSRAATLSLLGEVDSSDRSWTAPWTEDFHLGEIFSTGKPYEALLPMIFADPPSATKYRSRQ